MLYLDRAAVEAACRQVDPVAVVEHAFVLHARGQTVLPEDAHLAWKTREGHAARSLAMPAVVGETVGTKIINGVPANLERGLPRASGLTLLFDHGTGRPLAVLEGARISALRTAAVSALAARLLGPPSIERLALVGAGDLAAAHLELLPSRLPRLQQVRLYDIRPGRAHSLARDVARGVDVACCRSAEEAIRGAELVVPATTAAEGYIRHDWLAPGALLVNVSLDDPLPEVVLRAGKVFVDDWRLVAADSRRLLGRMLREGLVAAPGSGAGRASANGGPRTIDGELGELVVRARPGRTSPDEVILLNPFGLAIEDVALARAVYEVAVERGLGLRLPL